MSLANFLKSKAACRKHAKVQRQSLDTPAVSRKIVAHLFDLPELIAATSVFLFWPLDGEVDLRPLTHRYPDKHWALPRVTPATASEQSDYLVFHHFEDDSQLVAGAFGVMEPPEAASVMDLNALPADAKPLVLVPGLMFDEAGYRVGYGKSFYDRYFASLNQPERLIKIGVVADALLVTEIPSDDWDLPVDMVVTEKRICRVSHS